MNSGNRPVDRNILHDYVDDQLDDETRLALARHLGENAADAALVGAYREQNEALQSLYGSVADEPTPQRLLDTAARFSRTPQVLARTRLDRFKPLAIAAILCLMFGGLTGWWLNGTLQTRNMHTLEQTAFVDQVVRSYQLYAAGNTAVPGSGLSDVTHFAKWFQSELKVHVLAPSLKSVGYQLDDARILPSSQGTAGQLIYHNGSGVKIGFYINIVSTSAGTSSQGMTTATGMPQGSFIQQHKLSVYYWNSGNVAYAIVGPMPRDAIQKLVKEILKPLDSKNDTQSASKPKKTSA